MKTSNLRDNCLARLSAWAAAAALVVLTACTPPAAAAPSDKPKPTPLITIKKNDGTVIRGEFVSADGSKVTLKPVEPKAPSGTVERQGPGTPAGAKTFGAPVDVAWADMKSISHGLTRQKALMVWKQEHKADLCDDCQGDALADCDVCKGTGHDPGSAKDCKTCKGEMVIDCKQPKCEDGKIPCPAPCLKATDSGWKPDESGKRWRTFRGRGGATARVSEDHLGEIVKIEKGEVMPPVACDVCKKVGTITCPDCHGKSKSVCPTCKVRKNAADCPSCEAGKVDCQTCYKTGLKNAQPPAAPVAPEAPVPATPAPVTPAAPPAAEPGVPTSETAPAPAPAPAPPAEPATPPAEDGF